MNEIEIDIPQMGIRYTEEGELGLHIIIMVKSSMEVDDVAVAITTHPEEVSEDFREYYEDGFRDIFGMPFTELLLELKRKSDIDSLLESLDV